MSSAVEARLAALGIVLPPMSPPMGTYVPFTVSGNLLFLAGQSAKDEHGEWLSGQVGGAVSVEDAYVAARLTGIRLLAATHAALGSLDRVQRVLKVLGFVNAVPGFRQHPAVINGCSDLFVEVFGEAGRHARSAVGVASLPEDVSVEIEAILEIAP
jgi:enamine deaminase RidA (YjgF/YER057c/UK114 family)